MSVGTALRIVHFAYYTERENNGAVRALITFDVRRVPRAKRALSHKRPNRSCARGNLPRRPPGNLFGRVYTRLSSCTPRANAHTLQASPTFSARKLRTGRFGGSSEIQSLAPRPLEQSFVPFLPVFSFFLSFSTPCKTTMQNKIITGS